jgi:hypothetical protein
MDALSNARNIAARLFMDAQSSSNNSSTSATTDASAANLLDADASLATTTKGDTVYLSAAARSAGADGLTLDNVSRIARHQYVYDQFDAVTTKALSLASTAADLNQKLPDPDAISALDDVSDQFGALSDVMNSVLGQMEYDTSPPFTFSMSSDGKIIVTGREGDEKDAARPAEAGAVENLLNNAQYGGTSIAAAMRPFSALDILAGNSDSSSSGSYAGGLGSFLADA